MNLDAYIASFGPSGAPLAASAGVDEDGTDGGPAAWNHNIDPDVICTIIDGEDMGSCDGGGS